MKHFYKLVCIALICWATYSLFSCEKQAKEATTFHLTNANFTNWEQLFDVQEVFQLQETESNLMTYARKCIFNKKYIVFLDYKSKRIYSFSSNGKYLRTIGQMGHAYNEYVEVRDINFNLSGNAILVFDGRGILSYNLDNGKFLGRQEIKSKDCSSYDQFYPIGNSTYLWFTDSSIKHTIVLDTPKEVRGLREAKRYHFGVDYFYSYQDTCRILSDYGEFYIDSYVQGQLKKRFEFDLGGKELPDNIRPKEFKDFEIVDGTPEYFKFVSTACETSKWLFVQFLGPRQTYYISFINKYNGASVFGIDNKTLGMGVNMAMDNYFIATIYPDYLPENSYGAKLLEKYKLTEKGSNPVVVKFKINEKAI